MWMEVGVWIGWVGIGIGIGGVIGDGTDRRGKGSTTYQSYGEIRHGQLKSRVKLTWYLRLEAKATMV